MIFAVRDLYRGKKRKAVLESEMKDSMKIFKFIDPQLDAELALANCEIDWAKERLWKQGGISLALIVCYILYRVLL